MPDSVVKIDLTQLVNNLSSTGVSTKDLFYHSQDDFDNIEDVPKKIAKIAEFNILKLKEARSKESREHTGLNETYECKSAIRAVASFIVFGLELWGGLTAYQKFDDALGENKSSAEQFAVIAVVITIVLVASAILYKFVRKLWGCLKPWDEKIDASKRKLDVFDVQINFFKKYEDAQFRQKVADEYVELCSKYSKEKQPALTVYMCEREKHLNAKNEKKQNPVASPKPSSLDNLPGQVQVVVK